jgi:hypothetical protein
VLQAQTAKRPPVQVLPEKNTLDEKDIPKDLTLIHRPVGTTVFATNAVPL